METDRGRLHKMIDSLPDTHLALAEIALAALTPPDRDSAVSEERAALAAAEQDSETIGHALAEYRQSRGWSQDDLAAFLGLTLRQLASLAAEIRPLVRSKEGTWSPGSGIYALAEAHGADGHRLFEAVADRPADT